MRHLAQVAQEGRKEDRFCPRLVSNQDRRAQGCREKYVSNPCRMGDNEALLPYCLWPTLFVKPYYLLLSGIYYPILYVLCSLSCPISIRVQESLL